MSTLTVGTDQQFSTIAAAVAASQDGDILEVQAGTYTNDFATINTAITIEGIGGMVNLVATEAPSDGKAILTTNADLTVRNVSFSGSEVADGNGAGIRFEGGDLVVENCLFEDNQEGLLSGTVAGGMITIRDSEFSNNGTGDGSTHNLYVGEIASLTIENSYFHDAAVGHEIKSRALETTITDSRIAEGTGGTGSYSVDLPNGGVVTITDNVIEQGANSQNPAIIHYGGEGQTYTASSLSVTANTVVNDLASSSSTMLLNQTAVKADVENNSVYGLSDSQIATGPAEVSGTITLASRPTSDLSHPWAGISTDVESEAASSSTDGESSTTVDDAAMVVPPVDTGAATTTTGLTTVASTLDTSATTAAGIAPSTTQETSSAALTSGETFTFSNTGNSGVQAGSASSTVDAGSNPPVLTSEDAVVLNNVSSHAATEADSDDAVDYVATDNTPDVSTVSMPSAAVSHHSDPWA